MEIMFSSDAGSETRASSMLCMQPPTELHLPFNGFKRQEDSSSSFPTASSPCNLHLFMPLRQSKTKQNLRDVTFFYTLEIMNQHTSVFPSKYGEAMASLYLNLKDEGQDIEIKSLLSHFSFLLSGEVWLRNTLLDSGESTGRCCQCSLSVQLHEEHH